MTGDPAPAPACGRSAPDHATRYEALRAYAAGPYAPSSREGLAVLLRWGVAAWMDAWSRLPAPPPRLTQDEPRRSSPLPNDATTEVVRVLAAMTLGHIQELRA